MRPKGMCPCERVRVRIQGIWRLNKEVYHASMDEIQIMQVAIIHAMVMPRREWTGKSIRGQGWIQGGGGGVQEVRTPPFDRNSI